MIKTRDLIEFEKATGKKIVEIVNDPSIIETLPLEPVITLAEKIDNDIQDVGEAIGLVYAYFTELSIKAIKKAKARLEREGYGEIIKLIEQIEK
jgi:hypothetical protein